ANPGTDGTHTAEEGRRIFPDKTEPTDGVDRSMVKVEAKVLPAAPGLIVYFGSFDLDDPSANAAPIDTNLSDGKDNNVVSGSKSGDFALLTGSSCDNSVAGTAPNFVSTTECSVEVGGTATAYFRTTMQPGDNFAIGASVDSSYRNGMTVNASNGSQVINSTNQAIHVNDEKNLDHIAGLRTEMLTVWRNLHIEVDSMGDVGNSNRDTGTITGVAQSTCPSPPGTCVVNTVYVISGTLDENRFQGGRIQIGSQSFRVAANGFNTSVGFNVIFLDGTPSGSQTLSVPVNFTIYDDDDFNDDDGTNMNGDAGENIDPPPHSLVENTDTPCPDSQSANNCNVFAPAYVKPLYDLASSEVPFVLNVNVSTVTADPTAAEIQAHFQFANHATEADSGFWTMYLNGAYQHDERRDGDGDQPIGGVTLGPVLGIVDALNGQGALIYMELTRSTELGVVGTNRVSRNFTVAHELGHLFYGTHQDGGLMATSNSRGSGIFHPLTLNKIRGGEFTDLSGVTRRITNP
ncbi:MAG TPA: hypothetical protein VK612_04045, partial [Pyrinomonadaceae bacterium]|nr:hypothetical protein [Pyrinomonadaceae bacterium]